MSDRMMEKGSSALGADVLQRNWVWLLALGIFWIVLGSAAIILPFAAALAFDFLLGAILAIGGIAQLVQASRCRGWGGFGIHALGGILALVAGGLLLLFPLEGVITLTLVLGAFFLVEGTFKLVAAYQNRALPYWGWMLFSGILGIVIGVLIWIGWPGTAFWVIGLLVGIELIFSGVAMVMLAISARGTASPAGR